MPEPEKPRKPPSPPSIRTPGPDPVHRPIPAGAISQAGSVRNALAAADPTADADEVIPEATAEMVDIKHQANGRHPNRPTGAI